MKFSVLKLGTVCEDKATKLKGTLTHWVCDLEKAVRYIFQPQGLTEEGQPVQSIFLSEKRLDLPENSLEEVDVPFEILGTQVEDKASGFNGMAVEFVRHINGCFHVVIQPQGRLAKTNTQVKARDFDLRGCKGEMIPEITEAKLKESRVNNPSPVEVEFSREINPAHEIPTR